MNTFKSILPIILWVGSTALGMAQTDIDALRYSTPMPLGTARSAALGNATSGLGGDVSTLNTNPAGIAKMGISEFSFSGGFNITSSENQYLGNTVKDQKSKFQINNLGIVYVPKKKFDNIKSISVGASYSRLASYSYKVNSKAINSESSYSDIYAEQLNNDGMDSAGAMSNYPFGSSLAFESGLIGRTDENFFYSIMELPITQRFELNKSGNHNDLSLGTGIAFNDKWMLGVSLGIPFINYEEEFYVRESDDENITDELIYWDKSDKYRTEGTGVNAKIGVLFQPVKNFRVGAAFMTPTRYSMKDTYATYFRADYDTYTIDNISNPAEGYFEYKMIAPLKFNGGMSYVNPDFGLVSVEYEYTNPSKTKYVFDDNMYDLKDYEENLNNEINSTYKSVHTLKAGVEGKIKNVYRVRAGFQYRTSAYQDQSNIDAYAKNTAMAISGGLGYRGKNFYIDGTYVHKITDDFIVPYTVSLAPSNVLTSKFNRGNLILTAGFKF